MGTLMKNGIPYGGGGGGDNSRTVTYEQYNNLSEAEKNSDTTFYVTDYPGGSVEIVDSLESTDTDKALSANMGRELKDNMIEPPSNSSLISSSFTSGSTYTTDENCWVVATAKTNATTYAMLTLSMQNMPTYADKICVSGVSNRTFYAKLYVKSGTTVSVSTEGAFGDISLYKLT